MRLQVFGINRQYGLQDVHGLDVLALQEKNPSQIVERDAVPRILRQNDAQACGGALIVSVGAQHAGIEKVGPRQIWRQGQRFLEHGAGALHVAFLHGAAADVHPAIGIVGIGLSHLLERRGRSLQIALQEQADSIIVPALPFFFEYDCLRLGSGRVVCDHGQGDFVLRHGDDGQVRDFFLLRRDSAQRCRKHCRRSS